MIAPKSLVVYKNHPAIVTGIEGDKINIALLKGDSLKVREKDIEAIHPGPCSAADLAAFLPCNVRETWELLVDDKPAETGFKEFAELLCGDFSPGSALEAWKILSEGLYFTGNLRSVKASPAAFVEAEEKKRQDKQRDTAEREAFLEKLKAAVSGRRKDQSSIELSENEHRFIYDVEALARGQTDKSRTLKDLGCRETPQEAHRLLLAAGIWSVWENPHPYRFGFQSVSARTIEHSVPLAESVVPSATSVMPNVSEERLDLTHLPAFAVDNAWSNDPDDAISLEGPDEDGNCVLWVHIADPAAAVFPGSPADTEARNRGVTLYLPEGNFTMLSPELTRRYILDSGPDNTPVTALSFKVHLSKDAVITDTSVFLSKIKVTRLSYVKADEIVSSATENGDDAESSAESEAAKILSRLFKLAERNFERRLNNGAVHIDFSDTHIYVEVIDGKKQVIVERIKETQSSAMVRECMVIANEACAGWAIRNRIPFPFISQEEGDLPNRKEWLDGLAGCWQLRRCMRPKSLSVKPGVHWGLGLDQYTQVTSPLRRYTDLLCHQQIRAFLANRPVSTEDDIAFRLGVAESAALSAVKAERASCQHWLCVYLSDKKDSVWEAVVLEPKANRAHVVIPALGFETQVNVRGNVEPNQKIELILLSANIPEGEVIFACR